MLKYTINSIINHIELLRWHNLYCGMYETSSNTIDNYERQSSDLPLLDDEFLLQIYHHHLGGLQLKRYRDGYDEEHITLRHIAQLPCQHDLQIYDELLGNE